MAKKHKRVGTNMKALLKHIVEIDCEDLSKFISTMSSGLKSELRDFEQFMDRVTEGLDQDRKNEAAEFYGDDAIGLLKRYPLILWQSVFISLYAFFEQEMNDICRRVRNVAVQRKNLVKVSVPKSNDVVLPAQKCLAEFGVRLATKSANWKRMLGYVGVRNLIIHNRGQLREGGDDESERVRKFARHHKYITIDSRGTIALDRQFCEKMVETMKAVLHQVIDAVPERLFH